MADDIDRAQEAEQRHRDEALKRFRIAQSFMPRDPNIDSMCIDCDKPIEPARLAAVSTSRCIACARAYEEGVSKWLRG